MKRTLAALLVLSLAAAACRRSSDSQPAALPPPPPVEPALGPSSGLVEPRAEALLRAMSDRLARATSLALVAEETYDEIPDHDPRRQVSSRRYVALRRPDRLAADSSGDAQNRSLHYDGKTLSLFDREQNVWVSGTVPRTIDGMLDYVYDQTDTVIPLGDFLYASAFERLMDGIQRGTYLGIHEAAGVPCHHLAFEQASIDWQLWIDAGKDPLPRKLVITYKTEDEVPQYAVTILKWNLRAALPDALFVFEPPADATRVDIPAVVRTGGTQAADGTTR